MQGQIQTYSDVVAARDANEKNIGNVTDIHFRMLDKGKVNVRMRGVNGGWREFTSPTYHDAMNAVKSNLDQGGSGFDSVTKLEPKKGKFELSDLPIDRT